MPVPKEVPELIARFREHREAYRSPGYKEADLRVEFLEPFFKAMGWDVDNTKGYAEAYKEVVHEASLPVGGATKAPDYAFRLGGVTKFFVEAKKPSIDVKADVSPAYQLRRYAWSAELPLSILTDFEEFAVYDCTKKPSPRDSATTGRILYLTCEDYPARWAEVALLFSPEAIQKGAFDRFAESAKRKKGTATVDDAFLSEIEAWRDTLAHNLALRNTGLSQRELNDAVQKTIDRIIFLRICEDRGIEEYGVLRGLLNGERVYPRLVELFRRADERYNSGLFHFKEEKGRPGSPDTLTLGLEIDDKVLKDILRSLYYPESPYEFSVLSADILGHVYEQFLGKVIRLTPGHHAKVEEKPEVKKAGGVYYTPTYIVDYIVKNTVGKLLEGKSPKETATLRVLDPACGSGSFLLGAYQCLLDWHRDWYAENDPEKWARGRSPKLYRGPKGGWRLTTAEKKRILLDHIFGVDIDPQAVEVTKLSLLLKVLEGENAETLGKNLRLFRERALPDLGRNIQCGNSLIGTDFYDDHPLESLSEEERYRINAFDWEQAFPEIMKKGGFDAVIGNPPYVRSQSLGETQRDYYRSVYRSATGTYDIYVLFVERALHLLSSAGRSGFILPNKFITTAYGKGLRGVLAERACVDQVVDFEDAQVFPSAGTYTAILLLTCGRVPSPLYVSLGEAYRAGGSAGLEHALSSPGLPLKPISLPEGVPWTLAAGQAQELIARLGGACPQFGSLEPDVFQGLKTSADKLYVVSVRSRKGRLSEVSNGLGEVALVEHDLLRPVVRGGDVIRYHTDRSGSLFVLYPYEHPAPAGHRLLPEDILRVDYPNTWRYLLSHRQVLGSRDKGSWASRPDWYAYARNQSISSFRGRKLLLRYMSVRLCSDLDERGDLFFVNISTGGYGVRFPTAKVDDRFLLSLLNSKLLNFFAQRMTNRFRGGYFAMNRQVLEHLPLPPNATPLRLTTVRPPPTQGAEAKASDQDFLQFPPGASEGPPRRFF